MILGAPLQPARADHSRAAFHRACEVDCERNADPFDLSRLFEWRSALVVVRPQTLIRWHRAGFRLFCWCKSRLGRPPIPVELRELIRRMAAENPLGGHERIANQQWLKLGIQIGVRVENSAARRF